MAGQTPGEPGDRSRHSRADYERGLPGYHDPTAGFAGSTPARSALTLRAALAAFGLVLCTAATVLFLQIGGELIAVPLILVALIALVDLVWVLYRKRRGEPG